MLYLIETNSVDTIVWGSSNSNHSKAKTASTTTTTSISTTISSSTATVATSTSTAAGAAYNKLVKPPAVPETPPQLMIRSDEEAISPASSIGLGHSIFTIDSVSICDIIVVVRLPSLTVLAF